VNCGWQLLSDDFSSYLCSICHLTHKIQNAKDEFNEGIFNKSELTMVPFYENDLTMRMNQRKQLSLKRREEEKVVKTKDEWISILMNERDYVFVNVLYVYRTFKDYKLDDVEYYSFETIKEIIIERLRLFPIDKLKEFCMNEYVFKHEWYINKDCEYDDLYDELNMEIDNSLFGKVYYMERVEKMMIEDEKKLGMKYEDVKDLLKDDINKLARKN
jgi:hypothetical protein